MLYCEAYIITAECSCTNGSVCRGWLDVINSEFLAVIKPWRPRRRAPDAAKQVLRRAEASLALLPALFAAGGRIPSGALIPLLQALAQGLTVARLDLLHVKAAGACFFVHSCSLSRCRSS